MFNIQLDNFEKDDRNIMEKVNNILSIPESKLNSNDRVFIDYLIYILSNGFTKSNLSLPVKKREKEGYKYLKNYVELLSLLFKRDKKERNSFYFSEISKCGNEIVNLCTSLHSFTKKKDTLFKTNQFKAFVQISFFHYFYDRSETLYGSLTFYFYCLGFIIQKVDTLKLLLFYFLKERFPALFEPFDYNEFCPDLNSNNCLNLIKLYIENIEENKNNFELFFIYAFLIFNYKHIFQFYEKDIDIKILKKSVDETLGIVKRKTLLNKPIGMYVHSDFLFNLKNNINELQENNLDNMDINSKEKNGKEKELTNKNKEKDEASKYNNIDKLKEKEDKNEIKTTINFLETNNNEVNEIININDKIGKHLLKDKEIENDISKCENFLKNTCECFNNPEINSIIINTDDKIEKAKRK